MKTGVLTIVLFFTVIFPLSQGGLAQPAGTSGSSEAPSKAQRIGNRTGAPPGTTAASPPLKMSYQGLLTTPGGSHVADGSYDLTVGLYDSLDGGTLQWSESHPGVPVLKGAFSITLGVATPLDLQFNRPLYLQVTMAGGPAGPPYPLSFSPRSELTGAPYALAPWATKDTNLYFNDGSVGLGTSTPGANGIAALRLEIADEDGYSSDIGMRVAGTAGGFPIINFGKSRGTLSAPDIAANGEALGALRFAGWDGTTYRGAAHIYAFVDGVPAAGNIPGRLSFYTQSTGPGAPERMRLDRNGYLGIGTTNPLQMLSVSENMSLGGGIYRGTTRFLHSEGINSFFGGLQAGQLSANFVGLGFNTGIGYQSMLNTTTGGYNAAAGSYSLYSNSSGSYNTAIGYSALSANGGNGGNTAVGFKALESTTASDYNTAVGANAGRLHNNGYNNVFVGANTDVDGEGYYNVVAIGQGTIVTGASTARFGNAATGSYGGWAGWSNVSDARFKKNVMEDVPGLSFITKLRPVTYNFDATGMDAYLHRNDAAPASKGPGEQEPSTAAAGLYRQALMEKEKVVYTGFVAQEVESAARELGFDFSGVDAPKSEGDYYGLRYAEFVVPLVKAVQEQQKHIEEQDRLIRDLQKALASLTGAGGTPDDASMKNIK